MKILLITSSFLPKIGGAEFVVHELAQNWFSQGHEVCVAHCTSGDLACPEANYKVKKLKLLPYFGRHGLHTWLFRCYVGKQIKKIIKDVRPDFISAHFGYPTAIWLSNIFPTPKYLVTCHGPEVYKYPHSVRSKFSLDSLLAKSLNLSSGVIAISKFVRHQLEILGVDASKIIDIPNGVDLDKFSQKNNKFNFRSKFRIPEDSIIILSVGRKSYCKGFDAGIKAFAKLLDKAQNVFYVILGKNTTEYYALAKDLGVEKKVAFCDGLYKHELVAAYQQADIFFCPSIEETFSLVLLEAMAAGLAAVVTNVEGFMWPFITNISQTDYSMNYVSQYKFAIENKKGGLLAKPGNISQMADALLRLALDKTLRKEMGAVNSFNAQSFSWDFVSRMYLEYA